METYTITLSDAQAKALSVVALNPQDFLQNFANVQANNAIEEIVAEHIRQALATGGTISGTKEEIVLSAAVETAVERQARFDAMALGES
jgi:uncharacterized membrane protein YjfL (UPF0719 family)